MTCQCQTSNKPLHFQHTASMAPGMETLLCYLFYLPLFDKLPWYFYVEVNCPQMQHDFWSVFTDSCYTFYCCSPFTQSVSIEGGTTTGHDLTILVFLFSSSPPERIQCQVFTEEQGCFWRAGAQLQNRCFCTRVFAGISYKLACCCLKCYLWRQNRRRKADDGESEI